MIFWKIIAWIIVSSVIGSILLLYVWDPLRAKHPKLAGYIKTAVIWAVILAVVYSAIEEWEKETDEKREQERTAIWEEAYERGHSLGIEEGYADGYENGYADGWHDCSEGVSLENPVIKAYQEQKAG